MVQLTLTLLATLHDLFQGAAKADIFHAHITDNRILNCSIIIMLSSIVHAINQKFLEMICKSKWILVKMMHIKGVVCTTAYNKVLLQCYMNYMI